MTNIILPLGYNPLNNTQVEFAYSQYYSNLKKQYLEWNANKEEIACDPEFAAEVERLKYANLRRPGVLITNKNTNERNFYPINVGPHFENENREKKELFVHLEKPYESLYIDFNTVYTESENHTFYTFDINDKQSELARDFRFFGNKYEYILAYYYNYFTVKAEYFEASKNLATDKADAPSLKLLNIVKVFPFLRPWLIKINKITKEQMMNALTHDPETQIHFFSEGITHIYLGKEWWPLSKERMACYTSIEGDEELEEEFENFIKSKTDAIEEIENIRHKGGLQRTEEETLKHLVHPDYFKQCKEKLTKNENY